MQFRLNGESDPDGGPGDILPPPSAGVFYQQNTSDDSDNDQDVYEGYEPLNGEITGSSNVEVYDSSADDPEAMEVCQDAPSADVPTIESADTEIQREIWNAPRPETLTIELDGEKEKEIMNVMAGFTLPDTAIPTWAQGVSENQWKEDLLKRIRDRKSQ